MNPERLALVQGLKDTRRSLDRWNEHPGSVLRPWLLGAVAIACGLLLAVWGIAAASMADPTTTLLPGLNLPADADALTHIMLRNSLVLLLHALACVAGFIAGASLPLQAEYKTGISRWIHDKAGPFAIAFVSAATLFSLVTQAFVLGGVASDLAAQLDISTGMLILTLLPHALPELTALFLPLAAWLVASRRDDWDQLLAATFVTVAIAVPTLVLTACIEIWVWPVLLRAASPVL